MSVTRHPAWTRVLFVLPCLLLSGSAAPWAETLDYRLRLGPVTCGEVEFTSTPTSPTAGTDALALTMTARSRGVLSAIYPVRDRIQAVVAIGDWRGLECRRRIREGSRRLAETWSIDHGRGVAIERDGRRARVPAGVRDLLGSLWALREADLGPGDTLSWPVLISGRTTRLHVRAGQPTRVTVPAGEFDCLPLYPSLGAPPSPTGDGPVINLDRAAGRRPVRFDITVPVVGRIHVELTDHQGHARSYENPTDP